MLVNKIIHMLIHSALAYVNRMFDLYKLTSILRLTLAKMYKCCRSIFFHC